MYFTIVDYLNFTVSLTTSIHLRFLDVVKLFWLKCNVFFFKEPIPDSYPSSKTLTCIGHLDIFLYLAMITRLTFFSRVDVINNYCERRKHISLFF